MGGDGKERLEGMVGRKDLVNLYDVQTKAGEFVAADGTMRQAGIDEATITADSQFEPK